MSADWPLRQTPQPEVELPEAGSEAEAETSVPCLRKVVAKSVAQYLDDMGTTVPTGLHQRIVSEVERPLIETVLAHTGGNQSRAAAILGMTRSTLRSRIRRYSL